MQTQSDSSFRSPVSTWNQAMQTSNFQYPFIEDGPFTFREIIDYSFPMELESYLKLNVAIPSGASSSPLIIIQHGNMSFKEAHQDQMRRLASWGFTVVTPQLPNNGKWIRNGKLLSEFIELVSKWPQLISNRIDPSKIILIGHSFGGSAASLAASRTKTLSGLILLDPALYSTTVWKSLPKIKSPTFVLAADPRIFRAKRRPDFFARIPSNVTELVITGSTHDDAQLPSLNSLRFFGIDLTTTSEMQQRFLNSMTLAAIAISEPNLSSKVWQFFRQGLREGLYLEAKRK